MLVRAVPLRDELAARRAAKRAARRAAATAAAASLAAAAAAMHAHKHSGGSAANASAPGSAPLTWWSGVTGAGGGADSELSEAGGSSSDSEDEGGDLDTEVLDGGSADGDSAGGGDAGAALRLWQRRHQLRHLRAAPLEVLFRCAAHAGVESSRAGAGGRGQLGRPVECCGGALLSGPLAFARARRQQLPVNYYDTAAR